MAKNLSTEPYKGTRDFYPEDMAIQRYIFDTWAKTAESFGYERYDASILEPAEIYRSKTSEEIVNEQTYTFVDRGDREVTLRPEMTPTVARMVAHKRRELSFPVRWYSIPNLFRYERPQRGRLREHWQLNCDLFGTTDASSDIEMIALSRAVLKAFGAQDSDFEIRINDRAWLNTYLGDLGLSGKNLAEMIMLLDRKDKIENFNEQAEVLLEKKLVLPEKPEPGSRLEAVMDGLKALGITNVVFSPVTVRGFSYYTGVVFEIFDVSSENRRSLIGGGRYDDLASFFGGDPISGIGFGMGDVTMQDFLQTHDLLPKDIAVTAPTLMILPLELKYGIESQKIAQFFREHDISVAVDMSERKLSKKMSDASDRGVSHTIVVGSDEVSSQKFSLKTLATKKEMNGTLAELVKHIQ